MNRDWESWCRLCAKENGNNINVFIKNENLTSIADAILRYFSISIIETDIIPTKICEYCYGIIVDLINFSVKCGKIQDLFNEIQTNQNLEYFDISELRHKYGLTIDKQSQELKHIIDNTHKEEDEIKLNELSESYFIDENIDNFFKNENLGIPDEKHDNISSCSSNIETESSFSKLKIKKERIDKYNKKRKKHFNALSQSIPQIRKLDEEERSDGFLDENESTKTTESNLNENLLFQTKSKPLKTCEICNKTFSISKYNYHIRRKHNIIKTELPEPVTCTTCGKSFKKLCNLKRHENLHLPPDQRKYYKCPQCDKKFAVQASIQLHIKAVHIREKTFICEECGKAFTSSNQLTAHKVVHSDIAPFQCPKCPKAFKRLPSLKNHIDSHEDTKYICPICGCQLNTKTILRRHMVIHSDEKKYKCNFCQKGFKRTKTLKNHLILHTGLKPYECPFCDQTFANGSNCRKHQKNSHPIELAAMEQTGEKKICANVPRLEHLKAVNNAAVSYPGAKVNDDVKKKIETVDENSASSLDHEQDGQKQKEIDDKTHVMQ